MTDAPDCRPSCHGSTSPATQHADQVLTDDPFALLVGMMLDQQYPMEHAFRGPAKVLDRFGTLDPARSRRPTRRSSPRCARRRRRSTASAGSMAGRVQALARIVEDQYDGHAERLWTEATTGADLLARVQALPGFGKQKAQIFVALLAKQLDVRPEGWEAAVGDYAEDGYRSVADVVDPASLQKVRDFKKAKKAAAKAAAEPA